MLPHNTDQPLVGISLGWEVVARIRKCIVQMQIVHIYRDCSLFRVATLSRAEPWVLKHLFRKPEVSGVQDRTHLALEQEHDGAGTVISVDEDDGDALLLLGVDVDPVLFVEFQVDYIIAQPGEPVGDHNLGLCRAVNLALRPVVGESLEVI